MNQVIYKQVLFAIAVSLPLASAMTINGRSIHDIVQSAKADTVQGIQNDIYNDNDDINYTPTYDYPTYDSDAISAWADSVEENANNYENSVLQQVQQDLSDSGLSTY
jgi:hypothetical protein